ncbi:protein-L-isoaspartate(D-aspartate) O-methyltransferase [Rheinheimera baltica]|uniref:Protein-L-isoaspartate O-methyltransferase n=1 Tax=Rheinheimera baltica TaxID=67576 RepID=A0ABT9HWS4_9GAMM|nr:protein-L-isoaspartate(D-aspartate) O-methyltransferase [Rheinheimera baltica]MDP5135270.1 protein-L-isoaspartate(D-aspartate) O-methyltransferase [Rheinheimera baltica]MDP5143973.1 protein-L-isoaspartate(D-aspartate) O-methyltransferase [Rheinheimera baltica]MDP5151605.1 protein-L-isoaspartate(D-aspartate) O-methyltransferase [Rheinheimera baltica]MDP5189855.1 protein-L-isoaspartate(D-aspartate) O-methyltransferase [Rheinheimera baltica]
MAVATSRSAALLAQKLQAEGIVQAHVLAAIANTPRHIFVEPVLAHKAYENTALPIGQGQTISQPYIVARMTELLLQDRAPGKLLEIGTGSGYQTAILARLFSHVCSVERIKALQFQAKRRLQQLDLHNVSMKHGDGWQGWPSKAPFDSIIVTAAPAEVPAALLQQLTDGGRLVIPVGLHEQVLRVYQRNGDAFTSKDIEAVRFVPLVPGELA